MGFGILRLDFQQLVVMRHGLVHFSLLEKGPGEVILGRRILRPKRDSSFELGYGFAHPASSQKDNAKIVLSDIVLGGHCQRMRPQRFAVMPVRSLNVCAPT